MKGMRKPTPKPAAKPAPAPRASARARQVASPNARFNRGTAKPKTPAKRTIQPTRKGQKPITFKPGGLHTSTSTPQGQKIPAAKMAAAKAGRLGPKAQKQANFAANVLKGGRKR